MNGCLQLGRTQNTEENSHFRNLFPLSTSMTSPLPSAHWHFCNLAHCTSCPKKETYELLSHQRVSLPVMWNSLGMLGSVLRKEESHLNCPQSGGHYICQDCLEFRNRRGKEEPTITHHLDARKQASGVGSTEEEQGESCLISVVSAALPNWGNSHMYFIDSLYRPPPPILMPGHRGMLVHKQSGKKGTLRRYQSSYFRPRTTWEALRTMPSRRRTWYKLLNKWMTLCSGRIFLTPSLEKIF